tara:strand:+ start:35 stop:901 length:867 start_codon:yes stop_codon:yes gene_type:complete
MATGGLMSMPPYLKDTKKEDKGITPYDVNTPESARKGLPQRGLSKSRTRYSKGDMAKKNGDPEIWDADDWEYMNSKNKQIKDKKIKKVALGGYMDNFQIAEEEPLSRQKYSIGGRTALEEKYDRRRDYRAFQEGDLVEEEIVEEPLMAPVGMEEPLIEDEIAADDLAMEEDVAMEDAESVLDTSMLSEEEEVVVDAAIEMYPELEAILPKMVATEFTEDELVEGPGTGTSDSIPALLSDGEFVFTAKAVKNIGIDKLRKMMAQAEEAYDAGMVNQEEAAELAVDETIV